MVYLWSKGNLLKQETVAKSYEKHCVQIFRFHFMSLLTDEFIKDSHIQITIRLFSLKNVRSTTSNALNVTF